MANLVVKNFGPLKDVKVSFQKISVFIGPQGSGKSTLARLYASLSWIEKSLMRGNLKGKELTAAYFKKIITYVQIDGYLIDKTEIRYEGDYIHFEYLNGSVSFEILDGEYVLPKILYIPSERSFLSLSDDILSSNNLPSVFYELASDYSMARNLLGERGFNLPINGFRFTYSSSDAVSTITDTRHSYSVLLNRAASGIQSALPLSLVFSYYLDALLYEGKRGRSILSVQQRNRIQEIAKSFSSGKEISSDDVLSRVLLAADVNSIPSSRDEYEKMKNCLRRVVDMRLEAIIEEPEQNLFPLAQKSMLEYLVRGINDNGGSLLLTTHSPYILSSLNNLVFAGENCDKVGVNDIIGKDMQLKYSDISAYFFHDGECESILDHEMRNINPENIDSCSEEINSVYSELEDIIYESR